MIKKLLFFGAISLLSAQAIKAQVPSGLPYFTESGFVDGPAQDFTNPSVTSAKTTSASYTDVLRYHANKHRYRNPTGTLYNSVLAPMSGTFAFTHWGSVFLNPTGSLTITGLECSAVRHTSSPSPSVNIRMYLLNAPGGVPVWPPIDSCDVWVTSTTTFVPMGANFAVNRVVASDFACLFKCVPTVAGDSARLVMNNARTATSSAVASARYGEGLGLIRYQGTFYRTTNLYGTGNPTGTDYEFLVAPRVTYTATTSMSSSTIAAMCTNTAYTFNNTSSARLGHRMYNLNEFYRYWKPFSNNTIPADSVFVWNFGDGSPLRYSQPLSSGPISKTFTTVGVYNVKLTSNWLKMDNTADTSFFDSATASKTTSNCVVDPVGLNQTPGFENVNVYPNPAVNGKTTISGLTGSNVVYIYNLLGQSVTTINTEKDVLQIDLQGQPEGNYIVKIVSTAAGATKVVKVINRN